jgi:hypothetical protein
VLPDGEEDHSPQGQVELVERHRDGDVWPGRAGCRCRPDLVLVGELSRLPRGDPRCQERGSVVMSASEVLQRFGTWTFLRFVLALLMFLALHLARLPFVLIARLLETGMSRVDKAVTAAVSAAGTTREEEHR